jgi:fumarate reductase flavoprotein subunit
VNSAGERFSNEAKGYSEQAAEVLRQPAGLAFTVFDARIAGIVRQFEDYRRAEAMGIVLSGASPEELAERMNVPAAALKESFADVARAKTEGVVDRFGRSFEGVAQLEGPFHAVRVTGALFHTQGGLVVDETARVIGQGGEALPNLYAVGGAACGVSGNDASGYLSGNGLLTAVALGLVAGRAAGTQG